MQNVLDRSVRPYVVQQFVTADGNMSIATAVREMQSRHAEVVIVMQGQEPAGIVTEGDVLEKVVVKGEDSDDVTLRSIMSSPVITVDAATTVKEAIQSMKLNKIKQLPVIEGGRIIGLTTQKILAEAVRNFMLQKTFRKARTAAEMFSPILGNLGLVLQFAGVLLIMPALVGTFLGESSTAAGIYLAVVGLFVTGFALNTYGQKSPMDVKQSAILLLSSFLLLGLFGSIPYMYVNPFPQADSTALFVNSYFESISGFTTTGMSTISAPEGLPQSFNLYRSYTQWVGGLSFIYLIMSLFYPEEKLKLLKDVLAGNIIRLRQMLVAISTIFIAYTLILVALLYVSGQTIVLDDVSTIFSAITGGGFVPSSQAFTHDKVADQFIAGAAMIISALPFAFHYSLFKREFRKRLLGTEVLIYGLLLALSVPAFSALAGLDPLSSAFHTVSASTNTGFQYIDITKIPAASLVMLMVLMMIGGTAFSTAGGIKVGRFLSIFRRFARGPADKQLAKQFKEAKTVLGLFVVVAVAGGIAIHLLNEGSRLEFAIFESISALTTTGLGTGMIGAESSIATKVILMSEMVAGRFEIIAILYIFSGRLHKK